MFQNKFERENKIKIDQYVYHIGESFVNWHGRAQKYADGTLTDKQKMNLEKQHKMYEKRKINKGFEDEVI